MDKALTPFGDLREYGLPELRALISSIEEKCKEGEQVELPLMHYFSKAVYAREMKMRKGALVVGKIHKHQSLNIISAGDVSVLSQDGVMRVKAPYTFVSSPGAKRVIYAHEETVWTTVHGTEEKDLEQIEDEFIAKSYEEVVALEGQSLTKIGGI